MLANGVFLSDRYEILEKVGSGGMSDVYKAKCHKLNRFVAIKVLKEEFSSDKNFVSKFSVEAQSAAGLTHPNIVNIYDVGEDNGRYYIVMELVEGITLKNYIEKKGRLEVKEAVSITIQILQGIQVAHNNHIIHRDIKPQNIIISKEGKVKVTDFGIARVSTSQTISSNAMGSVHYISPEQARGGYSDERSDIYSLGISLYEMVTGTLPFQGDTAVAVALQHIQGEISSPKEIVANLPISIEKIIYKCTQKKPERRYLNASDLLIDLKKSLVTPNEDFVKLIPLNTTAPTVMLSNEDVSIIKKEARANLNQDKAENEDLEDDLNPKVEKIMTILGVVAAVL
ncbi:MAG: Stk1 family PASTA domain-containing Ser/Thr kinase, partial [Clostridiales bacterium]|nr:Stk1 family PASTA domain-containing Ser/Thr kinase [Clostridiales bacterium]